MATVNSCKPDRLPANSQADEESSTSPHDVAEAMARALRLFGSGTTKPAHDKPDAPS
jgi:hypothetical protein